MTDPYWRYSATERDERAAFPGYFAPDVLAGASHAPWSGSERIASDLLHTSSLRYGSYNFVGLAKTSPIGGLSTGAAGIGAFPSGSAELGSYPTGAMGFGGIPTVTPGIGGHDPVGTGTGGLTSLQDSAFVRRDASLGVSPGVADVERATSVGKSASLHGNESSVLFVDGLPTDCTRREVGHLFRPFIGFKEIRLFHKESRHRGDKARVLCFVEFADVKCAMVALEALQGYKFDDRKLDAHAPILKIQFAHFPMHLPS